MERRRRRMGVALPGQWHQGRIDQAYKLALLGASNEQMAEVMQISLGTLEYWMRTKVEFQTKVNAGKTIADSNVAEALYKRAVGYDYTEEQAFNNKGVIIKTTVRRHAIPDTWAGFKWLISRQREKWTDVSKVESTQTNINITKIDFSGLSMEELKIAKRLGLQQITSHVGDNN